MRSGDQVLLGLVRERRRGEIGLTEPWEDSLGRGLGREGGTGFQSTGFMEGSGIDRLT